jgi:hypothetical protein
MRRSFREEVQSWRQPWSEIEDRVAAAAVGGVARPAAAQAVRVDRVHAEGVASLLVEQVEDGEVHGRPSCGGEGVDESVLSPHAACG